MRVDCFESNKRKGEICTAFWIFLYFLRLLISGTRSYDEITHGDPLQFEFLNLTRRDDLEVMATDLQERGDHNRKLEA